MKNFVFFFTIFFFTSFSWAEEPPLPPGLGDGPIRPQESNLSDGKDRSAKTPEEPILPQGLGEGPKISEPALPLGLGEGLVQKKIERSNKTFLSSLPFDLTGFWEARGGWRTQEDPTEKDISLGESRLQLKAEKAWERTTLRFTGDFLYDPVSHRYGVQLEKGTGFLDIREASATSRIFEFLDIKIGRQILTWGTGDMLFINDLFPKDWNSFFIGRDTEYLKAPSDALKASFFNKIANIDIVFSPRFDSDRFIDGERISFFNSKIGKRSGRNAVVNVEKPASWFRDEEISWRLYRNVSGYELALYGYRGFWKSPGGMNRFTGNAVFPDLSVYGGSIRGGVGVGIGNIELGYYDSRRDRKGDNYLVKNGEFRLLAGYEQEIADNFNVGVQYYLEHMLNYHKYRGSLPLGSFYSDEDRHVLTIRLTKLLMNQNLILSLFSYFSPSDRDAYLRPRGEYKIDDHWSVEMGGDFFLGDRFYTFFSQFQKNSNLYGGIRYAF